MKMMQKLMKGLFWLLILALLLAPLGLIYEISQREREAYAAPPAPVIRETALGSVVQATRQDVEEYIRLSGSFVSRENGYMELTQKNPNDIRWQVTVGEEIQAGQVLGTYNGEAIISTLDGILLEINTYAGKPHLRVQLLTGLELQCSVPDKLLKQLRRAEKLTAEDGTAATLVYTANVKNDDGSTTIRLKLDGEGYSYGMAVKDLTLYTGHVYTGALVLPEKCLYQKNAGEDQPWYARQVTADGYYVQELQVERGYSNGQLVCITGIEDGTYYDSGYLVAAGG